MQISDKPCKQTTETRQAGLIEAALKLAAQRSPSDITTTDLAQAVGITQGAIFKHFASKEALWLATMDWISSTLMERLKTAAALSDWTSLVAKPGQATPLAAPRALAALQAVFMAHVGFVTENPGVPRLIFQELQHAQETALKARVRQLMQHYRQLMLQLLTQAQAEHTIDPHLNLQAAAVLFIGSVQGLVMQSLVSGNIANMTQQAAGVFALYQRGLQVCNPSS
jgi:AcrR family transcriptional regulator